MEKKISKNTGDLLVLAGNNFFPSFWRGLVGTFFALLPFLSIAIVMALINQYWSYITFGCLALVLVGPMQSGYIAFSKSLYEGEKANVFKVFCGFANKNFIVIALASAVLVTMYILGFTLFLVPGVVVIAFFSMVPYYVAKYEDKTLFEAMKMCFVRMRRNRISMMSYKFAFYLLFLILIILSWLAGFGVYSLASYSLAASIAAGIVCGIAILFLLCALVSYYHSANFCFFIEIEERYERKMKKLEAKEAKKVSGETDAKVEGEAVEVVESAPAESKSKSKK